MGQVSDLQFEKGKMLLRQLKDNPFIAITVAKGQVNIYCKGMNPSRLAQIRQVLAEEAEENEW